MLSFLKSFSRTVHQEHRQEDYKTNDEGACTSLTVWRKSLVLSCNGFTVIDSDGNLVYRVDNYGEHPNEIILMDASGKSVSTIYRRKEKLGLVDKWLIYRGEGGENNTSKLINKPIFWARKQTNYVMHSNVNVLARVFGGTTSSDRRHVYVIEGSYAQRSCKVYDESRRRVAEIKRKESMIGGGISVSFGLEVFVLIVRPGFDPGLAMAIVLLLDQMFS